MTTAMLSGARRLGVLAGLSIPLGLAGGMPVARAQAPPVAAAQGETDGAQAPPAAPQTVRKRSGKGSKPRAALPPVSAQADVPPPAPSEPPPLVELEQHAPGPPAPACKVPLSMPTYASDWVRAGVVSLQFPLPPGRPLKKVRPELRFQQQTTEVDLGSCYREYMEEQSGHGDPRR
jgi:hypothetical protein